MSEIMLQLKSGNADTKLNIRGDTEEDAKALAQAISHLWKSATDTEKQCLSSLVKSGKPLDYVEAGEKEFRVLCGKMQGSHLFVRKDKKGKYHVVMQREEKEQSHEASAVRLLRKRQIAKTVEKQHKGKKQQITAKDEMPSDDEKNASAMIFLLRRELEPVMVRIEKLEQELKKMKEEN